MLSCDHVNWGYRCKLGKLGSQVPITIRAEAVTSLLLLQPDQFRAGCWLIAGISMRVSNVGTYMIPAYYFQFVC